MTGDKGETGDKGVTGDPGADGSTGDKGMTGDKGSTGNPGPEQQILMFSSGQADIIDGQFIGQGYLASQASTQYVIPIDGTMKLIAVNLQDDAAGETGDGWRFIVFNGISSTTLECTIDDGSDSCTASIDEGFSAGDLLSIKIVKVVSGTDTTIQSRASVSLVFSAS
jgi:hypothetical protein